MRNLSRLFTLIAVGCVLSVPAIAGEATGRKTSTLALPAGFVPFKDKDGKEIPPGPTEREVAMGEKAAARIEKEPKIKILDPEKDAASKALYAKLNEMARSIGRVSPRPLIDYQVKVIEDDQVNAFTLPNGRVYFYTGLLDKLSSDDEIAAVMAHEISHNSCMHVIRGDKKAQKLSWIGLAAMVAAMAGGVNGSNIAAFTQYALAGVMSGYSVEYEKEADASGVDALIKAGYNPSAMATVMQRFAIEEKRRPYVELGIYQSHPYSIERVHAIEEQIEEAGLQFNPRAVSGAPQAIAVASDDRVKVQYKDVTVMEFAAGGSAPALARAEAAAAKLNELMRDNLKLYEVKTQDLKGSQGALLSARGVVIAHALPADAALNNMTPAQCVQKWRDNLRLIFWRETVNGAL